MDSINYLLSIENRGIKMGFERTRSIMNACDNPHLNLPVIQVVGTNGKGSVCAILANILKSAGYNTGLFTSPHLVHVNERIRINGQPIPNEEIDGFIHDYQQAIEKNKATFFETITAMACWYFNKNSVDIAIMETGLGGRLDSVSICKPLLTIITPISRDHMEILGETLAEIAFEKAGAMKRDILCLSAKQKFEVSSTLQLAAKKNRTPLLFLNGINKSRINVNIPGNKQKENADLVLYALEYLKGYDISDLAILNGLKTVKWYGRNQMLQKKPPIIFDVAHNAEGILCFLDYYKSLNILGTSILILALHSRKKIIDIIPNLENVFKHIICTETDGRNPMPVDILANYFNKDNSIDIIRNPFKAIKRGLEVLPKDGGMAIIGTHCLGPAINKMFKISFDIL